MSAREPLVSVVTPVYNGEPYLRECIESVLAQTYSSWDYTIVNNCSTDGSLEIAREYAARDPRIRVVDNERFVRVIENHNIAFRQISPASEYCKVVAADDWIFPECLERMVRVGEEHPRVLIVGAYALSGAVVEWSGVLRYPSTVVPGRDACRGRLLGGRSVFGNPSAVLFRSSIVRSREAFFNETNLHADTEVCYEFLQDGDFGFVHQVLTYRREREQSMTSLSRELNTYLPNKMAELVVYGPKYLSEEELERRIRAQLDEYYRYLGRRAFKRPGAKFWNYHREKLTALGHPMSRRRVAGNALRYALDLALNPKRSLGRLFRRLRRRP
jgi:glycosyltransferase involved in cell wall biosynthesis